MNLPLPEQVILMSHDRLEEVARELRTIVIGSITESGWKLVKADYCRDTLDLLLRLQERGLFLVESAQQTKQYQKGAHD